MKSIFALTLVTSLLLVLAHPGLAEDGQLSFGGDQFAGGRTSMIGIEVPGDAFAAGFDVTLGAPVGGSAHLAGFNVNANAAVTQNLYAAGFDVEIKNAVGGNLSAAGNAINVEQGARVGGNARLAGSTVTLAAPVVGSVAVAAETLSLSATVSGDLVFYGRSIVFAPGALVEGAIDIHAPEPIAVPATVAPSERVSFTVLEDQDYMGAAGETAGHVARGIWPAIWGLVVFWFLLVLAGAAIIAFMPRRLEAIHRMSETRPFRSLGWGALTFAMLMGLVPLAIVTIIGIFTLPLVFLFIAVMLGLGYILGAYLAGTRLARRFVTIDTNLKRLAVMAGSIVLAVLLGLLPILGWLLTLLFTAFGLGATARTIVVPTPAPRHGTSEIDPTGDSTASA